MSDVAYGIGSILPNLIAGLSPPVWGIMMLSNWLRRQVAKCASVTGRRKKTIALRPIDLELRTLLAAAISEPKLAKSPKLAGNAAIASGPSAAPLFPLADTFKLHSLPGATKTIYLDFNGQTVTGTAWNSNGNTLTFEPWSLDATATAAFTNNELEGIQRIWALVAEDFAPFNVNVTTEEPPLADLINSGGGDTRWGVRTIISSNDPLNSGAGGIAYIGSFNWDSDTPALVFNGGEKAAAETVSHEVGHALFLGHDGLGSQTYYGGHGSGQVSWGPVMGASFSPNLVQWSAGEYTNASNQQDDIAIITSRNGFGFRPDLYGNSISSATKINATKNGSVFNVNQYGIIEQRNDVDFFRMDVGNGPVSLQAIGGGAGGLSSNIDILMEVYDASGQLVASSNPDNLLTASLTFNATLGSYYVKIDGVGRGDPKGDGYTDYGSIGQFRILGTYADPENSPPVINDQTLPAVRENSPIGTIVGTPVAIEPNDDQTLTWEIIGGNTQGAFAINASTGQITVANPLALDVEINPTFALTVKVTDNGVPSRFDTGVVRIEVLDVVTWRVESGVLTVKGTASADKINVFISEGVVKVDDGIAVQSTGTAIGSLTAINLLGLQGNDSLRLDATLGTTTANAIRGAQGDDTLFSGLGNDILDGGDNLDTVTYIQALTGAKASLAVAGSQNTVGAGFDTLISIENLVGSNFGDTLTGNGLANVLEGGGGADVINGEGGDDTVSGGAGADSLNGGEGNDTLYFDTADVVVNGANGIDTARLVSATAAVNLNLLVGSLEIVDASASTFHNRFDATGATWQVKITGGSGNDTIIGGAAGDILEGGIGNDNITGASGNDTVRGGHGNDTLRVDHLDSVVDGGQGADTAVLVDVAGAATINLTAGQIENVDARSSSFNNVLNAADAPWNVTILGGSGNDTITGGQGSDVLSGGAGNDSIIGSAGNDSIEGGAGADSLDAGAGNDGLSFDNSDTRVFGGDGADTAKSTATTGAINLNLLTSQLEAVNVSASEHHNVLDASGVSWIVNITGGKGNDTIKGGSANDKLAGNAGNDVIEGGKGNDVLEGGAGIDTVSYLSASGSVTVNLTTGKASGAAGTDTLSTFENIIGSAFNDKLTGNSGANVIRGGGGLDIINGAGGLDSIIRP